MNDRNPLWAPDSDPARPYPPTPWKACRAHEGYDGPYFEIDDPDERAEYDARPFVSIEAVDGTRVVSAHDCFKFKTRRLARLLACAPDLERALRETTEALMRKCEITDRAEIDLMYANDALLAKIEGEGE